MRLGLMAGVLSGILLAACGPSSSEGVASMDVTKRIISLERAALDRWVRADPDGYLSLYAKDASYFDTMSFERRRGQSG